MNRQASVERSTKETQIRLHLVVDGSGDNSIKTGIGFFDHMLDLFAVHGLFDLKIEAQGDLHVDYHHTVEDTGIVMGQAFSRAVGDKFGIRRYGQATIPMDEALSRVVVDFGGRPFLRYNVPENLESIGPFPVQLTEEFLRAFCVNAQVNLHVDCLAGRDSHHIVESIFKALARAVSDALTEDPRVRRIPSTKGVL